MSACYLSCRKQCHVTKGTLPSGLPSRLGSMSNWHTLAALLCYYTVRHWLPAVASPCAAILSAIIS